MSKKRATTLHELQRENQMMATGHDRFIARQAKNNDLLLDKSHFSLLETALSKVSRNIADRIAAAAEPANHRPFAWVPDLKSIDPELLAYLALVVCMKSVSESQSRTYCLRLIGGRIEMENFSLELQQFDKDIYNTVTKETKDTYTNVELRNKAAVFAARKKGFGFTIWDEERKIKAAAPLLSAVLEASDVFEVWTKVSDNKTTYRMGITEEASTLVADANYKISWNNPVAAPMVTAPLAWTAQNLSPYLDPAMCVITPLIRHASKKQRKMLVYSIQSGKMQPALDAINAVQRTKYVINEYTLCAAEWAWKHNKKAGSTFPFREKVELPKVLDKSATAKDKAIHHIKTTDAIMLNREADANRSLVATDFKMANELKEYECFFIPHSFDSRGRIYPISHFSHHRADYVKSLFSLAAKKPIGERGAYWLAIQVANTGDFNKLSKKSFDDRIAWVMDNADRIAEIGNDFESTHSGDAKNIYWSEADKPFAFLAACREFYGFWKYGTSYESGLPINLDGSNSGIQHYAAANRDKADGTLVNLVPAEKPADVYQVVADKVIKHINDNVNESPYYQEWIDFGLNRKIVKRNVMTFGYSSKTYGFAQQLVEDFMDPLEKQVKLGFIDKHPFSFPDAAATALAKVTWDAVNEAVVSVRDGMKYWQQLSQLAAKNNKTMSWYTLLGFPVDNSYYKNKSKRLRLYMYDRELETQQSTTLRLNKENTHSIDSRKCSAAISPNMIHSLDSTHLMQTVLECLQENVSNFVLIHDSFGTLPADTDILFKTVRETFVDLYSNQCVYDFIAKQMRLPATKPEEFPIIPPKGNLVIKDVLKSNYCFA